MDDLMKNSDLILRQLDEILERKKVKRQKKCKEEKKAVPLSEAGVKSEQHSFSLAETLPNIEGLRAALIREVEEVFEKHSSTAWIDDIFNPK